MALDLNSLVPTLVNLGFELADQIVISGSYKHNTAASYNPSTGGVTPTTTTKTADVLVGTYSDQEKGEQIEEGDKKAVIKASELSGVTPSLQDTITLNSVVWQVVDFKLDPTNSVYIFQIRRTAP